MVGSPYSHRRTLTHLRRKGVTWLGSLVPRERWIAALASGEAVARVCTIAETFGVVDVAARAMGMNGYTLCTGEIGSLTEVGAKVYTDIGMWSLSIRERMPSGMPILPYAT